MTFSYSESREGPFTGDFETREEAAAEAFACEPHADVIYVGENGDKPKAKRFAPDAWCLIEQMQDNARDDEQPEQCEDWLEDADDDDRRELVQRVAEVIDEWATENGFQPTWFTVDDVRQVERAKEHCVLCSREMTGEGAAGACLECVSQEETP